MPKRLFFCTEINISKGITFGVNAASIAMQSAAKEIADDKNIKATDWVLFLGPRSMLKRSEADEI